MFPHEPLPEQIGPYKILRHLSARGNADLYLGQHVGPMGFQRDCVLKLVPAPTGDDVSSAQELVQEAKICARLSHPSIVQMYDFFQHGDRLVLVFEHFAGTSLARLLSRSRRRRLELPDGAVWFVAYRLFSALAHAHSLTDDAGNPTPVVHRDVQPSHVVISADAQVRLAGFGIAKIAGTDGTTAVGFIKGTPAYMAPEQARGEPATERVDVYAAGLVTWEMLAGQPATPGHDSRPGVDLLRMIAGQRVPSILTVRADVPREIAAAIDACLELSPDKRTIRCADVERWLRKMVDIGVGRDLLKERLVQLRTAAVRASAVATEATAEAAPVADAARLAPRFPGVATRATGRRSEAADGARPSVRPSGRVPGIHAPLSHPPPPIDAPYSVPRPSMRPSLRPPQRPAAEQPTAQNALAAGPAAAAAARGGPPPLPQQAPRRPQGTLIGLSPPRVPEFEGMVGGAGPSAAINQPMVDSAEQGAVPNADTLPAPAATVAHAARDAPSSLASAATPNVNKTRASADGHWRWMILGVGLAAVVFGLGVVMTSVSLCTRSHFLKEELARSASSSSGVASGTASSTPVVVASSAPVAAAPVPSATASAALPRSTGSGPAFDQPIPAAFGLLVVKSPPKGSVYVSGQLVGETDTPALALCGQKFVRVGTGLRPEGIKATTWLAPGQSVTIACGRQTDLAAWPERPLLDKPGKK